MSATDKKKADGKVREPKKSVKKKRPEPGTLAAIRLAMEYAAKHPIEFEGW